MVYTHIVKRDGKYYEAGENVPENAKTAIKETSPSYSDKDITFEADSVSDKKYTKSEITTMKTAELQELAARIGVENAESMTGSTLKKLLIEKFGL